MTHRRNDLQGYRRKRDFAFIEQYDQDKIGLLLSLAERSCPRGGTLLIRREIPRLCRGGSKSLTVPEVCFSSPTGPLSGHETRGCLLLTLTDCDQAPLRGQQS
jgi:hypothetical protein